MAGFTGSYALWAAIVLVCYIAYRQTTGRKSRLPLPPGPKPIPGLGNIKDFPPRGGLEFEHWLKHKDLYGKFTSVTALGITLVVIHDRDIAHDLLESSAIKTSGRPSTVMANKLCGYDSVIPCQDYNPMVRRSRKYLHRELVGQNASKRFRAIQEAEVARQLVRSLEEPDRLHEHYKTTAAATILQIAYGYSIEPRQHDTLVELVEQMMSEFSRATAPMSWAVDIIPALQYLPEGFPGTGFKKTAREWRKNVQAAAHIPYRFVRQQMTSLVNRESFVSRLVEQVQLEENRTELKPEEVEAIMWSATTLYGAGADTTVITLTAFTLAMIRFPEAQRRAQEEIDRVIGKDRLPVLDDRENLPYVDALIKETIRWWPIAAMGFPHVATEEMECAGYCIPKGAFILPAARWFLHDPEVYRDPDVFDPERFLAPRNEADPMSQAFGFGRRICVGRFFANDSLYLNIAQTLTVFNVLKKVDENGREVEVDHVKPIPGILTYPTKFDVRLEPRSEKHVELIRQAGRTFPFEPSDAPHLESVVDFKATY